MLHYNLWALAGAATWPFWLIGIGWLLGKTGRPRGGKTLLRSGVLLAALIGISPLSYWVMRPLEQAFSTPQLADISSVVMLTGAEQLAYSRHTGRPEYSEAAERIITAVELARQFPKAQLVLAGGMRIKGSLRDVEYARQTAMALGIAPDRIILVTETYNTRENAIAVARLKLDPSRMALVTSAFHMPRAMLCFQASGLNPIPYPVDTRIAGETTFWQKFQPTFNAKFKRFDDAIHEWIGILAYWMRGYTNSLWPVPKDQFPRTSTAIEASETAN